MCGNRNLNVNVPVCVCVCVRACVCTYAGQELSVCEHARCAAGGCHGYSVFCGGGGREAGALRGFGGDIMPSPQDAPDRPTAQEVAGGGGGGVLSPGQRVENKVERYECSIYAKLQSR